MKNLFVSLSLFAAVLLSACGHCPFADKKPVPAITAATFNIFMAPAPEKNFWNERKDAVAALVLARNFDIFGTQEGFAHQLDDIAKATGYKFVGAGREDGKRGGEHSAIFYNPARFELLKSGDFWFSETPDKPVKGWDAMCKRVCSWGEFFDKISGKKFRFFSLHYDHMGKVARAESSKLLAKKIREIAGSSPAVCVGDFNATPDEEPMQILFADGVLLDSKKLSKTPPYGPRGTWHNMTGIPCNNDRIDYVFVTKGIDVLSYEVVSDKATDFDAKKRANPQKKIPEYPSDHFPVVVRLVLK